MGKPTSKIGVSMENLIFDIIHTLQIVTWRLGFKELSCKLAFKLIKFDNEKKLNKVKHVTLEGDVWGLGK